MFLVCDVFKQDHVVEMSGDHNDRRPSRKITTLPGLVVIGTVVVEM